MRVILEFKNIPKEKEQHFQGILVSLFDVVSECIQDMDERKFRHFLRVRLSRSERKILFQMLEYSISLITKNKKTGIQESVPPSEDLIPKNIQRIYDFFSREVSPSTEALQWPESLRPDFSMSEAEVLNQKFERFLRKK